jgi:Skp family chaperone for outer membrane proteins
MSLLSLIPTPVLAGGAVVAAVAAFAGGAKVEAWRDTGALDTEKAAHARDVKALQDEWQAKLNAGQALLTQAIKERDAERQANATAREDAANAYTKQIASLKAAAGAADARAQRVRDELTAAIAAAGTAGGNGAMPQTGPGPAACSGGGAEACRLLGRAIDLARRCTEAAAEQHSALAEAVASWPR